MKYAVVKRSVVVAGQKTSVSLEEPFWTGMKDIAAERRVPVSELIGAIDSGRRSGNLSSAIRLFVLQHYRERSDQPVSATEDWKRATTAPH